MSATLSRIVGAACAVAAASSTAPSDTRRSARRTARESTEGQRSRRSAERGRDPRTQARPAPGRAVDLERPAERLDSVDEPPKASAFRVGSTGAVVDDLEQQPGIVDDGVDDDAASTGVLVHVRESGRSQSEMIAGAEEAVLEAAA